MRKLLAILLLFPLFSVAQNNVYTFNAADGTPMKRYDTTINGWNARVLVKQNHDYSPDSNEVIIDVCGLGEVGTDTGRLNDNGYGYWISNARWDGTVTLPSGNHHPIIIALQPSAAWQGESVAQTRLTTILSRWKIKRRAVHVSGLSMGGWQWTTYVTSDAGTPYARAFSITSVVESGGVIPNDNLPYPNLFDQFADFGARGFGGNLLSFQQDLDGRDALARVNRMNTNHSGSFYIQTNLGARGHSNFNDHYNPNTTNWTTSNPEVTTTTPAGGISMSMAQWQLMQGDTTSPASGGGWGTITANAGTDYAVAYDQGGLARTFNLSGSQTGATSPTYSWVSLFDNPSASTIVSPSSATTSVTGATVPGFYGYVVTVTEGLVSDSDTIYVQVRDLMQRGLLPCRSGPGVRHYIGGTLITGKVTTTEIYVPYITRDNVFPGLMGGDTIVVLKNPNNDTGYWKWVFMGDFSGQRSCPITVVPDTSSSTVVSSGPGGSRGWYLGNGDSATIAFVKFDGGAWFNRTGIRHGFAADNGQHPYDSSDATVYTLNTGAVLNLGHDVEFTGWRFRNSNYMFQVKKNSDSTNQFATYDNYRFRNIYIHHNYGYMLGSEGMYLGHTAWDGIGQAGNNGRTIMMDSLRVEKNVIKKAGKDGIQIANQKTPALIFDNTIDQSGYRNASSHRWSVFIGGNATGSIYRNSIVNARGAAGTLGMGTVYFYENIIDSVGEGGNTEPAIYANKSVWTGNFDSLKFRMYGNLITRVLKTGNNSFVQVDNLAGLMGKGKIYNNTFVSATKTLISQMVVTNASDTVENNTILSSLDISTHPLAGMDSYRVYQLVRSLPDGTPVSFYDLTSTPPVDVPREYDGIKVKLIGVKFKFQYR